MWLQNLVDSDANNDVLNDIKNIYIDTFAMTPPSEFKEVYDHLLNSILWHVRAAQAFEQYVIWKQPHWLETGGERLDKAVEFMQASADTMEALCFD